jgi:hypothetical protein
MYNLQDVADGDCLPQNPEFSGPLSAFLTRPDPLPASVTSRRENRRMSWCWGRAFPGYAPLPPPPKRRLR